MSPRIEWYDQERTVDPAARTKKRGVERWIEDVFYGFGQMTLLGLPMLVLVFQTPYLWLEAKTAGIAAYLAVILAVGTFRGRWASTGVAWPRLTASTLTKPGGYRRLARRGVYLASTLGIGAYGGALVDFATGSWVAGTAVAVVASVAGVAALPRLDTEGRRAALGRVAYYVLALGFVLVAGLPFDLHVGSTTAPFEVGILALYAAVDVGPELGGTTDAQD